MELKQISRKHVGKKVSESQEAQIKGLQEKLGKEQGRTIAWLEAKHVFFESIPDSKEVLEGAYSVDSADLLDEKKNPGFKLDAKSVLNNPDIKKTEIVNKRKNLTIAETKLGVTMVINQDECKTLGLNLEGSTKEAIVEIRKRLGLPAKKEKK